MRVPPYARTHRRIRPDSSSQYRSDNQRCLRSQLHPLLTNIVSREPQPGLAWVGREALNPLLVPRMSKFRTTKAALQLTEQGRELCWRTLEPATRISWWPEIVVGLFFPFNAPRPGFSIPDRFTLGRLSRSSYRTKSPMNTMR
jgi:hypothetical protein